MLKALAALTVGEFPFLRVEPGRIELLNPHGGSLTDKPDFEPHYVDPESGSVRRVHSLLTPENFRAYYDHELSDIDEDKEQQTTRCPFHDDANPSLSLSLSDGTWFCHGCSASGGMIHFEMRLLDTEDKSIAWKSVAKKLGVKLLPRKQDRGKQTHQHTFTDKSGEPLYELRRYEDGSARFYTPNPITGKFRAGLKGVKRVPYNLPQLIKADTVVLTEGEKKADCVSGLDLSGANGNPLAVTSTGSESSWRPELVDYFVGKRVLVFADSDDPGQRYANAVSASFTHAGIEHKVIDFAAYGNDVRDFLRDHSGEELVEFVAEYSGVEWLQAAVAVQI